MGGSFPFHQVLRAYELETSQKINFDKSAIYVCPNVHPECISEVSQILNIPAVACHERYLGLPTVLGRRKKEYFYLIRSRVWNKLNGWKEKFFSKGSKEILFKADAQCIPNYYMSCLTIPHSLCGELNSMVARFLCGSSQQSKKIHWISRRKLCCPKSSVVQAFKI